MPSEKILAICEEHDIKAVWEAKEGAYILFRRGRNSLAVRSNISDDEIEYHLIHFISQLDGFEKKKAEMDAIEEEIRELCNASQTKTP